MLVDLDYRDAESCYCSRQSPSLFVRSLLRCVPLSSNFTVARSSLQKDLKPQFFRVSREEPPTRIAKWALLAFLLSFPLTMIHSPAAKSILIVEELNSLLSSQTRFLHVHHYLMTPKRYIGNNGTFP